MISAQAIERCPTDCLTAEGTENLSLHLHDHDRLLVERAKRDPQAFGEIYDRHFESIYRFVFSRVRHKAAAEDVTSEVFTKALRSIGRYEFRGKPIIAWPYRIASNCVADHARSYIHQSGTEQLNELFDPTPPVDELAIRHHEALRIWLAVGYLSEAQRRAIVLRFHKDMRVAEIAAEMGRSEGAVKLLLHRALRQLRTWTAAEHLIAEGG